MREALAAARRSRRGGRWGRGGRPGHRDRHRRPAAARAARPRHAPVGHHQPLPAAGGGPFGEGRYRVDGGPPLRARPMGPVLDGIARPRRRPSRRTASPATCRSRSPRPAGLVGGDVRRRRRHVEPVPLRAAAGRARAPRGGVRITVTTPLVSRPVRRPHGRRHGRLRRHGDGGAEVPGAGARPDRAAGRLPGRRATGSSPTPRRPRTCWPRPPCSAGGSRSRGWVRPRRQGDARFADLLGAMGARSSARPTPRP